MDKDKIVFDIETKNTFADVGGQKNIAKLDTSFIGAYSYNQDKYLSFHEKDIDKLGSKITANELILEGNIKVYYSIGNNKKPLLERIHIYKYDSSIDGYIEMNENNELYPQIIEKIMKLKK